MTTAYRLVETFNRASFKVVNFKYGSNIGGEEEGKISKTKSPKRRSITFLVSLAFSARLLFPRNNRYVKLFYSRVILLWTIRRATCDDKSLQKVLNLNQ